MTVTIIVAILDQDAVFRRNVRGWLESTGDIAVVGEAGDEREALERIPSWRPAVLLADLDTLGNSGVAHLVARFPEIRLLILHGEASEPQVLEALQKGALGHLVKEDLQATEVIEAVRAVARGEAYLSPTVAGRIVEEVARRLRTH